VRRFARNAASLLLPPSLVVGAGSGEEAGGEGEASPQSKYAATRETSRHAVRRTTTRRYGGGDRMEGMVTVARDASLHLGFCSGSRGLDS
jgi:hypothetical protein